MQPRHLAVASIVLTVAATLGSCCLCPIAGNNFDRYQCRSKQTEAKANLKALVVSEEAYRADNGKYAALDAVGFLPQGEKLRYDYVLVEVDDSHFVAEARGKDEQAGDVWRIDNSGVLTNVTSVCGDSQE